MTIHQDLSLTIRSVLAVLCLLSSAPPRIALAEVCEADICVYGGTEAGVAASLAAARRGMNVILIEPFRHLGGMAGGGLRLQLDCLYPKDIGGIAKELLEADARIPGAEGTATLQERGASNEWQARLMLRQKVADARIRCFTEYRLDAKDDVVMDGDSIRLIHLNHAPVMDEGVPPPQPTKTHALAIRAKAYIDASYEGDLMAFAGCDYTVGREPQDRYAEPLAGQGRLRHFAVDPYVVEGDASSGLLPMISPEPYEPGQASRHTLAYSFRMNRMRNADRPLPNTTPMKPLGREVDRDRYELVLRSLRSPLAKNLIGWPEPNYNRRAMISSGIPGRQADYPDGDWATRSAIWREWIDHVKTMNILLGKKNPVLPKGEYPDNNDFPDQLYVRMGRRLIGEYVVTQHDLMHQTVINDSVGLAYYAVDMYPTRLVARHGKVASEGELFMRLSPGPYPIPYRALVPKKGQCDNLIVPVCMSASHVAMASIRMAMTYAVLGEAAGIAASHAAKTEQNVQELDVESLRADMHESGIVMQWDGTGYGPKSLRHWPEEALYWRLRPAEYKRIPIRLDPSWDHFTDSPDMSDDRVAAFDSVDAWCAQKPKLDWLFPFIDTDSDGAISQDEHREFLDHKTGNR